MLDFVFKQESLAISSVNGKKKKSNMHSWSNLSPDVICKGEDALSFLSSLLDFLLLKKDIADRYMLLLMCLILDFLSHAVGVGILLATSNAMTLYILILTGFMLFVSGILL